MYWENVWLQLWELSCFYLSQMGMKVLLWKDRGVGLGVGSHSDIWNSCCVANYQGEKHYSTTSLLYLLALLVLLKFSYKISNRFTWHPNVLLPPIQMWSGSCCDDQKILFESSSFYWHGYKQIGNNKCNSSTLYIPPLYFQTA